MAGHDLFPRSGLIDAPRPVTFLSYGTRRCCLFAAGPVLPDSTQEEELSVRRIQYLMTFAIWTGLCGGCDSNKDGSTAAAASEATEDSAADDSTTGGQPTTGEPGTGTGEPGDSPCEAFAENATMCDPGSGSVEELAMECESEKMSAGPECTAAFDAYIGGGCEHAGRDEQERGDERPARPPGRPSSATCAVMTDPPSAPVNGVGRNPCVRSQG